MEVIFTMTPIGKSYLYVFNEKNELQMSLSFQPFEFEKTVKQLGEIYQSIKKVVFKGPIVYTTKYVNSFKNNIVLQYDLKDLKIEQIS